MKVSAVTGEMTGIATRVRAGRPGDGAARRVVHAEAEAPATCGPLMDGKTCSPGTPGMAGLRLGVGVGGDQGGWGPGGDGLLGGIGGGAGGGGGGAVGGGGEGGGKGWRGEEGERGGGRGPGGPAGHQLGPGVSPRA